MNDEMDDGPFPLSALVTVVWSFFKGEQFASVEELNLRMREYLADDPEEDIWEPDEKIPLARLRINYFGVESPEDDEYTDFVADIESDNGVDFTAGELMLKLNNIVAPRLKSVDHCYFEGLFLTEDVGDDGVPVYEMSQGS